MEPVVDIAFDCLPLRSIGRVDVPLDASPGYRERCERLQRALDSHGTENAYYLYNARCVYRLANSEVDGMLRFSFEGTVLTDCSDCKAERADLSIDLVGQTCGPVPTEVEGWLRGAVQRAVLIEFDRFISAGRLSERIDELAEMQSLADLADFAGMNV